MNPMRRAILVKAFKLFDILIMLLCMFAAILCCSQSSFSFALDRIFAIQVSIKDVLFTLVALLIWHFVFLNFSLYQSKRFSKRRYEIFDVIKATTFASILLLPAGAILKIHFVNLPFISWFWLFSSLTTVASRILLRVVLRKIRIHGRNLRHVLIVGTNSRALSLADKILKEPEIGYRLIGFVDNNWYCSNPPALSEYRIVCDLDGFQSFIRDRVIDEVVVALPIKSFYDQASKIISMCEEQGVVVKHISHIFEHSYNRNGILLDDIPSICLNNTRIDGWQGLMKRFLDLFISVVLLICLMPVFLFIAIAIKLDTKGPLFFVQERIGLNKRKFKMYKFRTMCVGAETLQIHYAHLNEVSGPVFKIQNDPRVTPVGRWLRKTSLDELPQFFNVLKGDMSLVGPRPLPVRDFVGFSEDWHRRRFSVPPGITCLWQVVGRNKVPFNQWMELDMEYIDKWTLWLDIKIILKTIPSVLRGIGAM